MMMMLLLLLPPLLPLLLLLPHKLSAHQSESASPALSLVPKCSYYLTTG